jgi:hypothetical protein
MAGPSKKVLVSDEVLYKLFQENEYSVISETKYSNDSEINMNILSCGEQSVGYDKEDSASDSSSMQHGIWAKSGAEQPRLPFTGKPDINIDFEDLSNPLKYFELFVPQKLRK